MIDLETWQKSCITIALPKKPKCKSQCLRYQDTLYFMLDVKVKNIFGLQLQIWEKAGKALAFQRDAFRSQVENFAIYETKDRKVFRRVLHTDGQFSVWQSVGVEIARPTDYLTDVSLISESSDIFLFARFMIQSEHVSSMHWLVETVLASLFVYGFSDWSLDPDSGGLLAFFSFIIFKFQRVYLKAIGVCPRNP